MSINWPNNYRGKKKAGDKRQPIPRGMPSRALQGSTLGLVLFSIFITNLKGEGRRHKNEICRWLLITEGDLQTPGRAGMKFRGSFGEMAREGQRRLEGREMVTLRAVTPVGSVKGISRGRSSESLLATIARFTPACWETPMSF